MVFSLKSIVYSPKENERDQFVQGIMQLTIIGRIGKISSDRLRKIKEKLGKWIMES